MNLEIIKEALKKIDAELMASPINEGELESVKQALTLRIMFIEQLPSKVA